MSERKKIGWLDLDMVALFGVLLPLVTLGVEAFFHLSGSTYVDPIPSWWHVVAIAGVAVANFVVCAKLWKNEADAHWIPFAIGATLGVSVFYALVFAPIAPIAVVLILGMGLGLLPLAPLLSFLCAVRMFFVARRMRRELPTPLPMNGFWQGVLCGLLYLVAAEAPNVFTDIGLRQAVSTVPETSRAGVRIIRTFGSETALVRNCYPHSASISDIPIFLLTRTQPASVTVEDAREIYYRVYGRSFNMMPRPHFAVGMRTEEDTLDDSWWGGWDSELAGEKVGGHTAGVSLAESTIGCSVRPNEATSYTEWAMKFQNRHWSNEEARMQIELPPGGVVTRATLWVNGQEREAAFGERKLVRKAYQSVVTANRDPLLVTQVAPNKVMVQCFPVPPMRGPNDTPGEIKIRIGITAPCVVPNLREADVVLPKFSEHGFGLNCDTSVRVECPTPYKLDEAKGLLRAQRDDTRRVSYAQMPLSEGKSFVSAAVQSAARPKHSKLFVVVDGGGPMRLHLNEIADAFKGVSKSQQGEVWFASDAATALGDAQHQMPFEKGLEALRGERCAGGPDNMHVLADVWKRASASPDSAVVWIHGPQPVLFGGEALANEFKAGPTLYDVELGAAPNRLLEKLPSSINVVEVPRVGSFNDDLNQFVSGTFGTGATPYVVTSRTVDSGLPSSAQLTTAPAVSSQLVSLWAYSETKAMLAKGRDDEAVKFASRQRLVTPVTGAVVLETAEDYKKNGIDPNNPDNNKQASPEPFHIGAAPEPEEYALMGVALLAVAWQLWRKRLRLQRA
jgi:hypothetical protein